MFYLYDLLKTEAGKLELFAVAFEQHLLLLICLIYFKIYLWWDYFVLDILMTLFPMSKLGLNLSLNSSTELVTYALLANALNYVFVSSAVPIVLQNVCNVFVELYVSYYNKKTVTELLLDKKILTDKYLGLCLLRVCVLELATYRLAAYDPWSAMIFVYGALEWYIRTRGTDEVKFEPDTLPTQFETMRESWHQAKHSTELSMRQLDKNMNNAKRVADSFSFALVSLAGACSGVGSDVARSCARKLELVRTAQSSYEDSTTALNEIIEQLDKVSALPLRSNLAKLLVELHANQDRVLLGEKIALLSMAVIIVLLHGNSYLQ